MTLIQLYYYSRLPVDRLYSTAMDIVTALNLDFPDPIKIAFDRTGRFILIKAKNMRS